MKQDYRRSNFSQEGNRLWQKIGREVDGDTVVTTGNLTENFKVLEITGDCPLVLLLKGG
jgi:hypothetical protein